MEVRRNQTSVSAYCNQHRLHCLRGDLVIRTSQLMGFPGVRTLRRMYFIPGHLFEQNASLGARSFARRSSSARNHINALGAPSLTLIATKQAF